MRAFRNVFTACLIVLLGVASVMGAVLSHQKVIEIADASFELRGNGGGRQLVKLPHGWNQTNHVREGGGTYTLEFDLEELPVRPWALYASRISSHRRVFVNGLLVHDTAGENNKDTRPIPLPGWIDVPAALLKKGRNQISMELMFGSRAGLSSVWVGDAESLRAVYEQQINFGTRLPQALNVCAAGLSLFMILIWWRRRSEKALGLFGALWILVSLRNLAYYTPGTLFHAAVRDYGFFFAQVLSVWLLGQFGLAWSNAEWNHYRRILKIISVALLLVGLGAAWGNYLIYLRYFIYPVMLMASLPAMFLVARGALRQRTFAQFAMLFGLVLTLAAAVHDYMVLSSNLSVMSNYWLPFATPVTLGAVILSLLDRFIDGLRAVELHKDELEKAVADRTRELAKANAEKSRFLAVASHDLRQPVAAISLFASLIQEQVQAGATRMLIDKLADAALGLDILIKGLLNLAKFDSGAMENRPEVISLKRLIHRVCAHERGVAELNNIEIRLRVPENLYVYCDPVLLEQVMRNLIGNAVRYTDKGGVLIAARSSKPDVRIEVWDTGRGVRQDQLQAIFEEFVQLEKSTAIAQQGLGLGLAIARSAAIKMGSLLTVDSRFGQGSRFSLIVPASHDSPLIKREEQVEYRDVWRGLDVIVVENDAALRNALISRLLAWGASVQAFDCMTVAKQKLMDRTQRPDLIITDLHLGDGLGTAVINAWAAHFQGASLAALVVTGETDAQTQEWLNVQGFPYLLKPFDSVSLTLAVARLLKHKHAEDRS